MRGTVISRQMQIPEELYAQPERARRAYLRATESFNQRLQTLCERHRVERVLVDTSRNRAGCWPATSTSAAGGSAAAKRPASGRTPCQTMGLAPRGADWVSSVRSRPAVGCPHSALIHQPLVLDWSAMGEIKAPVIRGSVPWLPSIGWARFRGITG